MTISLKPVDVIGHAQQLKRAIKSQIQNEHPQILNEPFGPCKTLLLTTQYNLHALTQLNQPKQQLPARLQRHFPFKQCRLCTRIILKLYNVFTAPQRLINNHLHGAILAQLQATDALMQKYQQQNHELEQKAAMLQQQYTQLTDRIERFLESHNAAAASTDHGHNNQAISVKQDNALGPVVT